MSYVLVIRWCAGIILYSWMNEYKAFMEESSDKQSQNDVISKWSYLTQQGLQYDW